MVPLTEAHSLRAAYDAHAAGYDASQRGARWALYDEITLASLAAVLPPAPARVLDAGAGSGKLALPLLERGHLVTLLDPSPAMLAEAGRKLHASGLAAGARLVEGGLEALPFADGAFDAVVAEGDPLGYCADRALAARELLRVLRPHGTFYVAVDHKWACALGLLLQGRAPEAWAAVAAGRGEDPYGMPVHAFGAGELRALLEGAGAVDVRVAGKGGFVPFLPDESLEALWADPAQRAVLLGLEAALAGDPGAAGLAAHLHASGRKPSSPEVPR